MRALALIAYFLIFLPGSMILIPWGLFLVTGIFTAETNYKVMIALADVSLILLAYFSTKPMTTLRVIIEVVAFGLLMLPFIVVGASWPLRTFNYFLFMAPFATFTVLYLISLWRYIGTYRKTNIQDA
jgi:hypothetical protein